MVWLFGGSLSGEGCLPLRFVLGWFSLFRKLRGEVLLGEDGMDDFPGDVCESKFSPLESVGEAFVVDA